MLMTSHTSPGDPRFEPCLDPECRVERGDGEAAAERADLLQSRTNTGGGGASGGGAGGAGASPPLLFLDFDRTLCSTRSGASPLKGKGVHALDPALRSLIASRAAQCHIVTRNSNVDDIATFLARQGLPPLGGLHHVGKGKPKTDTILSIINDGACTDADADVVPVGARAGVSSDSAQCKHLFVDDDVRELLDDRLPASGVYRILMCRAV